MTNNTVKLTEKGAVNTVNITIVRNLGVKLRRLSFVYYNVGNSKI